MQYRFKHYRISNRISLTLCILLDKVKRKVSVGYTLTKQLPGYRSTRIRQFANQIAKEVMEQNQIGFVLNEAEPIMSDYITFRSILEVHLYIVSLERKSNSENWDDIIRFTLMCIGEACYNVLRRYDVDPNTI